MDVAVEVLNEIYLFMEKSVIHKRHSLVREPKVLKALLFRGKY
jgi:hypothetical protein